MAPLHVMHTIVERIYAFYVLSWKYYLRVMNIFTTLREKIFVQVYKIITGLAQHSQAAADTIIYLWQHVSETPSMVKFQGIYLCVIS